MQITESKTLVFDADVIIHFIQAECFSDLRLLYPNNKKVILEKVKAELSVHKGSRVMLDNAINVLKFIEVVKFPLSNDMLKEYSHLTGKLMNRGKGESACMSYCKYTKDVVVSSNLSDVGEYCKMHSIDLITTLDLVEWALLNRVWTEKKCNTFIQKAKDRGAIFPKGIFTINDYVTRSR